MSFERGPYLQVAAFCEQVIEDKAGVLSLIRVVDRMIVTAHGPNAPEQMPPTTLNWMLVLSFKSGEARGSHPVRIVPELPSGGTLAPVTLSIHLEGANRGAQIISRFNLPLEMPGVYWFKVFVDEELATQIPVEVIYSRIVTPGPARG